MESVIRRDPAAAAREEHDLAIVGGGVYGVALALEAARRGIDAVLVERGDFGGETSRNSLRIVHGGLRYLQRLDLSRFFESVRERSWFLRHFPDQVHPLPCLMPLYGRGARRPSVFRVALAANDLLSRRRNDGLREDRTLPAGGVLDREHTLRRFPGADRNGLRGGALWWDAVMPDSERLLIEMLRWAVSAGATALNYVRATDLIVERKGGGRARAAGVRVEDEIGGGEHEIRARLVVNCAGPWSREVAAAFHRDVPELFLPSLAVNVVLDREPIADAAVALTAQRDGARTYFLHTWKGRLFAGTLHAPWRDDSRPDEPPDSLVETLLHELNEAHPALTLRRADVLDVRWGMLPARTEGTEALADRPVIVNHGMTGGPAALLSVSGVKFTTARLVAEKTLAAVHGKSLPPYRDAPRPAARPVPDAVALREMLARDPAAAQRIARTIAVEEAVVHPGDLLRRRTSWGLGPVGSPLTEKDVRRLLEPRSAENVS